MHCGGTVKWCTLETPAVPHKVGHRATYKPQIPLLSIHSGELAI